MPAMHQGRRPDRLELSRGLEVIADRVARSGERERADQLLAAAAHLRAKARADQPMPPDTGARAYLLGVGLLVTWLGVVLLVVVAVAALL